MNHNLKSSALLLIAQSLAVPPYSANAASERTSPLKKRIAAILTTGTLLATGVVLSTHRSKPIVWSNPGENTISGGTAAEFIQANQEHVRLASRFLDTEQIRVDHFETAPEARSSENPWPTSVDYPLMYFPIKLAGTPAGDTPFTELKVTFRPYYHEQKTLELIKGNLRVFHRFELVVQGDWSTGAVSANQVLAFDKKTGAHRTLQDWANDTQGDLEAESSRLEEATALESAQAKLRADQAAADYVRSLKP